MLTESDEEDGTGRRHGDTSSKSSESMSESSSESCPPERQSFPRPEEMISVSVVNENAKEDKEDEEDQSRPLTSISAMPQDEAATCSVTSTAV